ncbi:hypothetical protein ABZ897_50290 [Nonomuraea sp. NPDC046802]|uniref:hypothetical protein n=1 Tax=Nonomuraea sp. NPDC046802 TaxID=3154919 RepID=UPI0033C14124
MLSMALHLREQDLSLREIAARLVITQGKKKAGALSSRLQQGRWRCRPRRTGRVLL